MVVSISSELDLDHLLERVVQSAVELLNATGGSISLVDGEGVASIQAVYNLSDDEPAPPEDVIEFAARLMGVPVPPAIPFTDAELTPMARSFYAENKRVSNRRIREELRVALAYPTYREGLTALWRDGTWRG